jgi:hypothetical protein
MAKVVKMVVMVEYLCHFNFAIFATRKNSYQKSMATMSKMVMKPPQISCIDPYLQDNKNLKYET